MFGPIDERCSYFNYAALSRHCRVAAPVTDHSEGPADARRLISGLWHRYGSPLVGYSNLYIL